MYFIQPGKLEEQKKKMIEQASKILVDGTSLASKLISEKLKEKNEEARITLSDN